MKKLQCLPISKICLVANLGIKQINSCVNGTDKGPSLSHGLLYNTTCYYIGLHGSANESSRERYKTLSSVSFGIHGLIAHMDSNPVFLEKRVARSFPIFSVCRLDGWPVLLRKHICRKTKFPIFLQRKNCSCLPLSKIWFWSYIPPPNGESRHHQTGVIIVAPGKTYTMVKKCSGKLQPFPTK